MEQPQLSFNYRTQKTTIVNLQEVAASLGISAVELMRRVSKYLGCAVDRAAGVLGGIIPRQQVEYAIGQTTRDQAMEMV